MACILVVEDQPASRDMLATLLGYHGHVVLQARDGAEGLALALAERPELAITDILMPGMDGYEFARRVRADPSLPDTRVMFYTATYLVEEVRRLAADCGVTYVLDKPAEPERILETVSAALAAKPLAVDAQPSAAADREHLRVLTDTLHRKVEDLKAEIESRERAEAQAQLQADRTRVQAAVSRELAALTYDYQAVLEAIVRQLADAIGDTVAIRLVAADGVSLELAALHHSDPGVTAFMRDVILESPQRADEGLIGQVIQSGRPALVPTITPEQLRAMVAPRHLSRLDRVAIYSTVAVPIRAEARTVGVIVLSRNQPGRPYVADGLDFLQDLADRAALAMSNARLYADLQSANADLERRVAERTAELRQRTTMIDAAGDAIIIRDLDQDIIGYWNRGAERLYGWTTEEAIGQSIHSLLQTEFPAPLADIKAALLRAGHWEGELAHTCRDGRRITVLSRWTLDLEAVGQPASFLEINTDITARKQAEAALREARDELERRVEERTAALARSEKKFRTLADNALVGIFQSAIDGQLLYANEALARLMEFPSMAELMQETSTVRYRRPADRAAMIDQLWRGGKVMNREVDLLTKTGDVRTMLTSMSLDGDVISGMLIDITDRKHAVQALRESEERLRTVTDTARVGLVIVSEEHRYRYANRSYAEILRLPTGDLVGLRVADVLAPVYEEQIRPRLQRAFQGERVSYELVLPTAAGEQPRRYAVTYEPSEDSSGPVVVVVIVDISEQRQAEQALRQSEERFAKAFRANPAAMIITRIADGMIIDVNQSYQELLGFSRAELVGHSGTELNILPDPSERETIVQRLRERESIRDYETTIRARSGDLRQALFSLETIELDGEACLLTILYDISVRKQAEQEIQRLNAELELRVEERTAELANVNDELQSSNSELQSEIEERTQLEGQIRANAERAVALSQLSRVLAETSLEYQPLFDRIARRISELVGDTCVVTLLSDDRQWLDTVAIYHPDPDGTAFMRALMAAEPYRAEGGLVGHVVQTGEALLIPVVSQEQVRVQIRSEYYSYLDRFGMSSLLVVPLRSGGRTLGTLGVSRDQPGWPYTAEDQSFLQDLADRAALAIENTRLFVDVREARDAADRANLAKSEFLSNMSHELRTPLNAIIGFTGTLLMKLPGPLNADQDKQLKTIQSSARHLLSLINDLLDVAKIESGKLKIYPEPVTCQEVLDEAVASLRPLADQKGLRLTADCPPEPIVLQTDRRSLSQIVINLVNNAIKFTEKGEVAISLRRTASNPAGSTAAVGRPLVVAFAVRDTGIGIKAEDQDRLFHAFEQISSAKAGRREGSGLGLHLSMRLAELIGGRIEFQSEYGVGSIFTLFMPEQ